MITVTRYHDISCGHRVVNHESKCQHLHGHNYRITFTVTADNLDALGRVLDFSVIKERLCLWLENNYDHKLLLWERDPYLGMLPISIIGNDVVTVPYNPTAENIAKYLTEVIAPVQLKDTGCEVIKCEVMETRKCGAVYSKVTVNQQ